MICIIPISLVWSTRAYSCQWEWRKDSGLLKVTDVRYIMMTL